jgi:hypothetical protein
LAHVRAIDAPHAAGNRYLLASQWVS